MLRYRLVSGILMGAAVIAAVLYAPAWSLLGVLLALTALSLLEFYSLVETAGFAVSRVIGVAGGCALVAVTYCGLMAGGNTPADSECMVLALVLIGVFFDRLQRKDGAGSIEGVAGTVLGVLYLPFLLAFLSRLAYAWDRGGFSQPIGHTGRHLLLYLLVVVKFTDVGAYTFGRLFGRHKCFPRLSPKKTWEGLIGGILTAVTASCIYHFACGGILTMTLVDAVVLGVALACAGIAGDLFESLLKRAAGIKDSGGVIPGMGGVMDVLDSLVFGGPVLYLYARLVLS